MVLTHLISDLAAAQSDKRVSCIIMLDLSSAFDNIDHDVLASRLSSRFGFQSSALIWVVDYLKNRLQFVKIKDHVSSSRVLNCGVPQGSVLGPCLFSLYISQISDIICSYGLVHHVYADDICLYASFSVGDSCASFSMFQQCIEHLKDLFVSNRLKLNDEKSDILICQPKSCDFRISAEPIGDFHARISSCVKYLGVLIDSVLTFDDHITHLCRSAFYFLRTVYSIRRYIDESTATMIINSYIYSRIDYCNAILSLCTSQRIKRLQRIRNCCAQRH